MNYQERSAALYRTANLKRTWADMTKPYHQANIEQLLQDAVSAQRQAAVWSKADRVQRGVE